MLSVHLILVRFQIKKQAMGGCKLQREQQKNEESVTHQGERERERERAGIRQSNMEKNGKLNRKYEQEEQQQQRQHFNGK